MVSREKRKAKHPFPMTMGMLKIFSQHEHKNPHRCEWRINIAREGRAKETWVSIASTGHLPHGWIDRLSSLLDKLILILLLPKFSLSPRQTVGPYLRVIL